MAYTSLLTLCLIPLQAVFGVDHVVEAAGAEAQSRSLQPPEIYCALTDPQIGFPALPLLPNLASEGMINPTTRLAAAFE